MNEQTPAAPEQRQPEPHQEPSLEPPRAGRLFLMILAVILAADLWTKQAVFKFLGVTIFFAPDGTPALTASDLYPLMPGFALEAALNLGAFNGWFSQVPWLLIGISALALPICLYIVLKANHRPAMMVVALSLIASGALGNRYDRITYGGVRDFIRWSVEVGEREWVWPNFNIADSAIVCGVALILIREWKLARRARATSVE